MHAYITKQRCRAEKHHSHDLGMTFSFACTLHCNALQYIHVGCLYRHIYMYTYTNVYIYIYIYTYTYTYIYIDTHVDTHV